MGRWTIARIPTTQVDHNVWGRHVNDSLMTVLGHQLMCSLSMLTHLRGYSSVECRHHQSPTFPDFQRTSTVRCHQSWAIFLHRYHLWCPGTRAWCCLIWCPIQQDRSCHNGERLISCFSTDKQWLLFFFVHYLVEKKEISLVYLNIRCVYAVNAILK